jgi:hypothetical protein
MLVGDGHTGVGLATGTPRYPVRTFLFEDGLRVVATTAEHKHLLGAQVLSIGGMPMRKVEASLRPFSPLGENEWSYRSVLPSLVNRTDILEAAGVPSSASQLWRFRLADGSAADAILSAGSFPVKGRELLGGRQPLWELRPDEQFWFHDWPASSTLYVNFRGYGDLGKHSAELGRRLDAQKPLRLVIDMRDNGGGDYTEGRDLLIAEILKRPWINRRDKLFVLVGRRTFSAAMVNAADFKSMTQATLIGEPIGEKPNSWQESRRFYLPNSGLPLTVSTRYYSFAPEGVDAITPHVHAAPAWRDWAHGRDTAMAAVWREVFRNAGRSQE